MRFYQAEKSIFSDKILFAVPEDTSHSAGTAPGYDGYHSPGRTPAAGNIFYIITGTIHPSSFGGIPMKKEEYRSILSGAIEKEVESYTFYREIEGCTNDEALKKIFGELAEEERKHRETLEEFLIKPITALEFDEAKDYKISETLDLPTMTTAMKPADGIALAIKKEEFSRDMYQELANLSTTPQQKEIFTNLANMESNHKARLEDIYTNMAFPEVW